MSEHNTCRNPGRCACMCSRCMLALSVTRDPSPHDLTHDEAEALAPRVDPLRSQHIDVACEHLADLARAHGAGGFELLVRADGRVTLRRLDANGIPDGIAAADLVSGSSQRSGRARNGSRGRVERM